MKKTVFLTIVSFVFAAAAYATAPTVDSKSVDTAPHTDVVESLAPAAEGGVYDTKALLCIEAAPDITAGAQEVRCWKCGDGSTDGCSGGDKHCYGERSDCQKKGCKITGSSSKCSSSKTQC